MKIACLKETTPNENRVALTPDLVEKYKNLGATIIIEKDAGTKASFPDSQYEKVGATIANDPKTTAQKADVIVKINAPNLKECKIITNNQILIANMNSYHNQEIIQTLNKKNVSIIALERMPRITRAQSMDILSSQNNIAGYKAVIKAANEFSRSYPMMMTAAGTVPPVKLLVMGVGVAGLQAIATAKRLGAVVCATDVRPATKEQVESLGANFIAVQDEEFLEAQSATGYAKEMSASYKKKQEDLIKDVIAKQDVIITTALIPGRPAPKLITTQMLKSMKTGSVIVDLASSNGGNCEASTDTNVKIIDGRDLASEVPQTTSLLFAKNIYAFIANFTEPSKTFTIDPEDEILKEVLIAHQGTSKEL